MPTEPTPAPTDLDAFDEWARGATDDWQRARVYEEAARRLADPALPADQRALAAVWGAPVGTPPLAELEAIASDASLDPVLRARVQAALAVATFDRDRDRAVELVEQTLPVANDGSVHVRTRLSLWLTASEVYQRVGRPGDSMAVLNIAGKAVKEDSSAPQWALPSIDAERLAVAARVGQDREQIARSLDQVANVARRLPPNPTTIDVVVKCAGVMMGLGAVKRAENHFEAVVEATKTNPEARGPLYQALLGLADARMRLDGPEAAMAVQANAIAAVEPLGDSPMLGWARRGLAVQILATDRYGDAAQAFADAAAVYERIGMDVDAGALRLEQAGALVHGDDPAGAQAVADEVAAAAADMPDDKRLPLEMRLHQVYAQVASYEDDLEAAAEHWLEVADRATRSGSSPLEAELAAAQLFAAAGDLDEAAAQFGRAELSAADTADPAKSTAMVMRTHAETLRQVGRAGEAAELARVAANHARTSGDEAQAIYLSVIAADSLHAADESQAALQLYMETLQAAEEAEMPSLQGAVHAAYANLLRDLGRTAEAAEQDARAAALGIAPEGSEKI